MARDLTEVEVDAFTHELIVFEVIDSGYPCVERAAGVWDTGSVGVLSASNPRLDENVIVTMAQGSRLDMKVGKDGEYSG